MGDDFDDIPSSDLLHVDDMQDQDIGTYINIQSDPGGLLDARLTTEPCDHGYRYSSDRPAKGPESRKVTQTHGTNLQIVNMQTDSMHIKVVVFAVTECGKLHPHTLTGPKCFSGVFNSKFNVEKLSPTIRIPMLEVQITKKCDVLRTLNETMAYLKTTVPVEYLNVPVSEGAINHHAVKFCYVVIDEVSKCHLQTLYSKLILNTRTNTAFYIEEVSPYSIPGHGGTVHLLMTPKSKMPKDFEVAYFMRDDDGNDVEVCERTKVDKSNIQKQYVVKVSLPPLSQLKGDSQQVRMKLMPKDGQCSNTIFIQYQEDGDEHVARKRKRLNIEAECSDSKVTKYGHCSEDIKMKLQTGIVSKQNLAQQEQKPVFDIPQATRSATISTSDMINLPDYTTSHYAPTAFQTSSANQSASVHEGYMTEAGLALCQPVSADLNQNQGHGYLQFLTNDENVDYSDEQAMSPQMNQGGNLPKTVLQNEISPPLHNMANSDLEKKHVPMSYTKSPETFRNQFGASSSNQKSTITMATDVKVHQSTGISTEVDTKNALEPRLLHPESDDINSFSSPVVQSGMQYVQPVATNSAIGIVDNNNLLPQLFPTVQNSEYFQDTNVPNVASALAFHTNETKTDIIDDNTGFIDLTNENEGPVPATNEGILQAGTHRVTFTEESYVLPVTVDPSINNIILTQQNGPLKLYPPGTYNLTLSVPCIVLPKAQFLAAVAGSGSSSCS